MKPAPGSHPGKCLTVCAINQSWHHPGNILRVLTGRECKESLVATQFSNSVVDLFHYLDVRIMLGNGMAIRDFHHLRDGKTSESGDKWDLLGHTGA